MGRDERFARMREQRMRQSAQDIHRMMASAPGGQPAIPAEPTDRFGVPIRVGDLVMYRANVDPIYEVIDVKPVLHPSAPPGSVAITLQIQMPVHSSTLGPSQAFVVWGNVAQLQEPKPAEVEMTKPVEAPAEPKKASAQPCGCDDAAGWVCEQHRAKDADSERPLVTLTD